MSAESQNCESSGEPLLGYGAVDPPAASQWLISRHLIATTDNHATI
jgi:hypothetical protein